MDGFSPVVQLQLLVDGLQIHLVVVLHFLRKDLVLP